ncbi:MAG: putative 4-hydroxybenzoate polyprenyltransferase [Planctomycetota bacterium]|nr:putative 4-hydroxybenzoate polyprenyltransferase [Planctomycetota bacterium]
MLAFFRDIKIEHSIFALPFALTAAILAGGLTIPLVVKILLALLFARTSAMAFNRLADARIDARNPRTSGRALPSGRIRTAEYLVLFAVPTAGFVIVCATIRPICLILSPVALLIVLGYSFTKRFTAATHFFLGLALASAPIGAWIALRGTLEPLPLLLGASVLFWTAGFDIIYACLDHEFDRRAAIHSLPARIGIGPALRISAACHVLSVVGLAAMTLLDSRLGILSLVGVALVGILLLYEHRIVRPDDLSRVGTAFFTINGIVSVLFFSAVALDVYVVRV